MARQVWRVMALALVLLALGTATAWAVPPTNGTIVLKKGKLGVTSDGAISSPGAVKWRAAASETGAACCTYRITGTPRPFNSTTATTFNVKLAFSAVRDGYSYRIDGYDAAGSFLGSTFAPEESYLTYLRADDDGMAGYQPGWSTGRVTGAYGGSLHYTFQKGTAATFGPTYGSSFGVVFQKCPACGIADIWLDSRLVATVDTYASTIQPRQILYVTSPDRSGYDGYHTITVELSPNGGNPDGRVVEVDGLAYLLSD
jgi:hypothetical protein